MFRLRSIIGKLWPRSKVKKAIILLGFIFLASSGGLFIVSEQTWFCNTCHIMNPYYASWQASNHSEVNCLECHVQPGLAGLARAKLNGLAQAVDWSLDRVSTKPNALIRDASCLREGCHAKESLQVEATYTVNNKYKFSHQGHIDATVNGLPLLCTTCHSHFEGKEHFKVSTQVCFICHFSKANIGSTVRLIDTKCRDCHDVPTEPFMQGEVEINHSKFVTAQLECEQLCHNKQMNPNKHVQDVRCLDCHEFQNPGHYSAKELHVSHSGKEKVECIACHEMINHTAKPIENHHTSLKCENCHQVPFEETGPTKIEFINLPEDCSLCHKDQHTGQFEKTCIHCHSEHGWNDRYLVFSHNEQASFKLDTLHAALSCETCHLKTAQRVLYRPLEKECESCHSEQSLAMQGITSLRQNSFEPDPHWNRVTCIDCHNINVTYQSTKDYAERCVSCHNEDYGQLFYEWLKIFGSNSLQADGKVPDEIIKHIEAIGFHHIQLSVSMWKDVIKNNKEQSD